MELSGGMDKSFGQTRTISTRVINGWNSLSATIGSNMNAVASGRPLTATVFPEPSLVIWEGKELSTPTNEHAFHKEVDYIWTNKNLSSF